jgi:hypothetical protein
MSIRDDREVNQEDLTKAARKVGEAKKHESELVVFLHITIRPDPEVQQRWSSQRNFFIHVHTYLLLFCYTHLILRVLSRQ